MIHIHTAHRPLSSLPYKEARLCRAFENGAHASEIVSAEREMQENPRFQEVQQAYDRRIQFHRDRTVIGTPANRTYLFALLMPETFGSRRTFNGSTAQRVNFRETDKNRIRLYPPLPFKRFDVSTDAKKDELEASLTPEARAELEALAGTPDFAGWRLSEILAQVAPQVETAFREGRPVDKPGILHFIIQVPANVGVPPDEYVRRLTAAQAAYVAGTPPDPSETNPLLDAQLDRFMAAKRFVDDKLERAGVRGPGLEMRSQINPTASLTHAEYLQLLALHWNGAEAELNRIFGLAPNPDMLTTVRAVLTERGAVGSATAPRDGDALLLTTYTELAQRGLSPGETLERFGMQVSGKVLDDYRAHRAAWAAGRAPAPEEGLAPLGRGESAAEWIQNPQKALSFLNGRLVMTPANQRFLTALAFYAENGWRAPANDTERTVTDGLDPDDVRALLNLIIQQLSEREGVFDRTDSQRRDLRTQMNFFERFQQIELGRIYEFMTDWQNNKVGALIAWVAAIAAVRGTYKVLTTERALWKNGLFIYGPMAGILVGMYQARQGGNPWWNGVGRAFDDFRRRENELPPDRQTLPGYWQQRFEALRLPDRDPNGPQGRDVPSLDRQKSLVCLSVISSQPVGRVTEFYRRMKAKSPDQRLSEAEPMTDWLPSGMRRQFGNMTSNQIAYLHFLTLERFFEERGRAAEQEVPPVMRRRVIDQGFGRAGVGLGYIEDKYVKKQYYSMIAVGLIRQFRIEIEGSDEELETRLSSDDPATWEILRRDPRMSFVVDQIRGLVINEERIRPSADLDMAFIMAAEADPSSAILRGTPLANLLERMGMRIEEYGEYYVNVAGRRMRVVWDQASGWVVRNGNDLLRWTGTQWEGVLNGVRGLFPGDPPPANNPLPGAFPPGTAPAFPLPGGGLGPTGAPSGGFPPSTAPMPGGFPGSGPAAPVAFPPSSDFPPSTTIESLRDPTEAELLARIAEIEAAEIVPGVRGLFVVRDPAPPSPTRMLGIGFNNRTSERYFLFVNPKEFFHTPLPDLVQQWRVRAVGTAGRNMDAMSASTPEFSGFQPWTMSLFGTDAEWMPQGYVPATPLRRPRTPLNVLLSHTPQEAATAFRMWAEGNDDPAVPPTRPPFRDRFTDPFQVPGAGVPLFPGSAPGPRTFPPSTAPTGFPPSGGPSGFPPSGGPSGFPPSGAPTGFPGSTGFPPSTAPSGFPPSGGM